MGTRELPTDPEARSPHGLVGGFVKGLFSPWRGFVFLCRHPGLWRYAVVPTVLNVLITVAVLVAMFFAAREAAAYIDQLLPPAWYYWVLKAILIALAFVLALAVSVAAFLILQVVLCCVFYDLLAQQVEIKLGMRREEFSDVSLFHHVHAAFRDLLALGGVTLLCLVLHVVPAAGSIASACITFYFSFFTCGVEYLDYPMALRGMRRKEKLAFARSNRSSTLGLGAAVFFFNFVPVVGSIVLTTAVVGAVLLHRDLAPQRG